MTETITVNRTCRTCGADFTYRSASAEAERDWGPRLYCDICVTTAEETIDITPSRAGPGGYDGPRISLRWQNSVAIARADDPRCDPWVLVPVYLLQYIDQQCITSNGDREAFNTVFDAAFPDGPPGGCGGPALTPAQAAEWRANLPAGHPWADPES